MDKTTAEISEMLGSDDYLTQLSGIDKTKTAIDHLVHKAVSVLFTVEPAYCLGAALKLRELGPIIIPELEKRICLESNPEAGIQAALLLLDFGSRAGVHMLLEAIAKLHDLTVVMVRRLREAGIETPGAEEAFKELLIRHYINRNHFGMATMISELQGIGVAVPIEPLNYLERTSPNLVKQG